MKKKPDSLFLKIENKESKSKLLETVKTAYKFLSREFPTDEEEVIEAIDSILRNVFSQYPKTRLNMFINDETDEYYITTQPCTGNTPTLIQDPSKKIFFKSLVYLVPQDIEPTHEFYNPSKQERLDLSFSDTEWVRMGGLLLRRIGEVHQQKIKGRIRKMMNNQN